MCELCRYDINPVGMTVDEIHAEIARKRIPADTPVPPDAPGAIAPSPAEYHPGCGETFPNDTIVCARPI